MEWLSAYIKAWSRHGIHFQVSQIPHLNIINPSKDQAPIIVDDECLIYRFPFSYRIKEKKGKLNKRFLYPKSLLAVLDGLPEGLIVVLPIPEVWRTEELSFEWFVEAVDRFLFKLPETWRYAIELHNSNYLLPDYFECLRRHNVAHVMDGSVSHPIFTSDVGLIYNQELSDVLYAVRLAVEEKKKLYVYVDGSTELAFLMELLNSDLKKLSPIKRSVAA